MRPLFADTFYWIALLNRREAWYNQVVALSRTLGTRRVLTTEWVLNEFLAFYSVGGAVTRQRAVARTRQMLQDPQIHVLPPSQATFLDGLTLYEARLDKHYSLIAARRGQSCLVVMTSTPLSVAALIFHLI